MPFSLPVLTELSNLHLGGINAQAGSSCFIDLSGSILGQCSATDANISLGQLVVSNIEGNTDYEIVVSGSSNGDILFIASASVMGGKTGTTIATDGQAVVITSKGNGSDLTIDVYGQIMLQSSIVSNQNYTVDYNIQVNAR